MHPSSPIWFSLFAVVPGALRRAAVLAGVAGFGVGLAAEAVTAQESGAGTATARKLGPRSFFPPEYTQAFFLDADALQDTVLWDQFERSLASGPLRTAFRREFGFRLEAIEKVRGAIVTVPETAQVPAHKEEVVVLEGRRLTLPPEPKQARAGEKQGRPVAVGGHQVVIRGQEHWPEWTRRAHVMPREDVLVIGSSNWIRAVLAGKKRGGVIHPRLTALTALRKPLGYYAVQFGDPEEPGFLRDFPFQDHWLTDQDPLRQALIELRYDEDKEVFTLRLILRFRKGTKGPGMMQEGIEGGVKSLRQMPMSAQFASLFRTLRFARDQTDLIVALDLAKKDLQTLVAPTGLLGLAFTPGPAMGPPVLAPVPVQAEGKPGAKDAAKPRPRKARPTSRPKKN